MNKVHKLIESEPPPPSQNNIIDPDIEPEPPDIDELQWIQDVTHSAKKDIEDTQANTNILKNGDYTPFVHKMQSAQDYHDRLIRAKHTRKPSTLPPPNVHPLYIPTPKYCISQNLLHDTT